MPEQPSWPDDREMTDAELAGTVTLAASALASPDPSPQAEQEARDKALAVFQDSAPMPRDLHDAGEPRGWTDRARRTLKRILRK